MTFKTKHISTVSHLNPKCFPLPDLSFVFQNVEKKGFKEKQQPQNLLISCV